MQEVQFVVDSVICGVFWFIQGKIWSNSRSIQVERCTELQTSDQAQAASCSQNSIWKSQADWNITLQQPLYSFTASPWKMWFFVSRKSYVVENHTCIAHLSNSLCSTLTNCILFMSLVSNILKEFAMCWKFLKICDVQIGMHYSNLHCTRTYCTLLTSLFLYI